LLPPHGTGIRPRGALFLSLPAPGAHSAPTPIAFTLAVKEPADWAAVKPYNYTDLLIVGKHFVQKLTRYFPKNK